MTTSTTPAIDDMVSYFRSFSYLSTLRGMRLVRHLVLLFTTSYTWRLLKARTGFTAKIRYRVVYRLFPAFAARDIAKTIAKCNRTLRSVGYR